jgi:hypothetical protein
LILHEKRDGLVGKNCGYWPHYSLQPSISRTDIILSLGNYDSVNTFFERDYANKYFSYGYKTAFFPAIYSIHIGKQHWETDGKNAYALNDTSQFSAAAAAAAAEAAAAERASKPCEPLQGSMSKHLDSIESMLNNLQPFALIRPSDGEYNILKGNTFTNCDSWTFKGGILKDQLLAAIQTVNPALYIGIPCNTCNKAWNCTHYIYNDFKAFGVPMNQRTYANIFMNSNWTRFVKFMTSFRHGFSLISSGGLKGDLPIKNTLTIDSKLLDNWDTMHEEETARVLDFVKDAKKHVFCFSAGPLSKIWIPLCFSKYPDNIYIDIGSSLDHITKGTMTRPYMQSGHPFQNESCVFHDMPLIRKKHLLYMCVFCNKKYIKLLQILLTSIKVYSSLDFDILIITQGSFYQDIVNLGSSLGLQLFVYCFPNKDNIFEAACARLQIFDYPAIDSYDKMFYIDTDIIIKKDLAGVFDLAVDDVVYVIPECGTISSVHLGGQFFDLTKIDPSTPGINSGTLLFKNTDSIKSLFKTINTHIDSYVKTGETIPLCMDQPFISYNLIHADLYNNSALVPYISLYETPDTVSNYDTSIVCHFSFPIGNFDHKFDRMKKFFTELLKKQHALTRGCICGWREGFCATCPDISKTKKYILTWNSNKITLHNGAVYTPWGSGKCIYLHSNCFEATWNNYSHIIYIHADTFSSIRTFPHDFEFVTGAVA